MAHAIGLDANDDWPHYSGAMITGDALIVQRARIRLRTFRGEWVLNAADGLPIVAWAGRKTDVRGMVFAVRRELEGITGVKRAAVSVALDATTRRATVAGGVTFDDGTQRGIVFAPFGVLGDPLPSVVASPR